MRTVIVGATLFGRTTASELIEHGHEVVIIDHDRETLEQISEELDCGLIQGDGSLPSVQRDAFADHADALIAMTNSDDTNIIAATVGRSIGFDQVIPMIVRSELVSVCEELGLKKLITPHATVSRSISRILGSDNSDTLAFGFGPEISAVENTAPASLVGKRICDIDVPAGCRLVGRRPNGADTMVIASEKDCIEEGDTITILCNAEAEDDAVALLKGTEEE